MTRVLVVAKAPVPGRVKTRLAVDIGDEAAAEVAAASLLDTLAACADAVGPARCHLAVAGDLDDAVHGERVRRMAAGWRVTPQVGAGFAERLVHAHGEGPGPVVQVGMDTPQLTPALLLDVVTCLESHPGVLGPAEDGGWWVLGLRDPAAAAALGRVEMSTPTTYDDTRAALAGVGVPVAPAAVLRDVDTLADAEAVAAQAPDSRFAHTWREVRR
ncbi:DUF2064 domain-containing protein [Nocardioides sp. zg-579]|uniref:DUF2064 domain-containing protein n=1 Tax=Nocardioides marmotae TaxID=2663857 RepID=A0A6I3JEU3_9ACTN|nr:DUF2064 domain-containing protein [Nocardioides marmotae]MCR6032981.1 DUF2064 domain-containing protein [Gordonia jinghuaiqii]MTB96632.1 DUF2064 domain-containing protein [Nocardioides marmotae]QKE01857.1 DUF2064 domain-containing protein [Nocardioides marmotae]